MSDPELDANECDDDTHDSDPESGLDPPSANDSTISKRKHPIHQYFLFEAESETSSCTIKGCKTKIKGKNTTILITHLNTQHKKVHEKYLKLTEVFDENSAKKNKLKRAKSPLKQNQMVYQNQTINNLLFSK